MFPGAPGLVHVDEFLEDMYRIIQVFVAVVRVNHSQLRDKRPFREPDREICFCFDALQVRIANIEVLDSRSYNTLSVYLACL
jgi:hypothetical protein